MATYARLVNGDAIEVTDMRHTTGSTPVGLSEGANLANTKYLSGRNAANSANISMLRVNSSDQVEFANVPYLLANPSAALQVAPKQYVDLYTVDYQSVETNSLINTTSNTFTDYTGSSVTISVASGEFVEVHATLNFSVGSALPKLSWTVSQDGVDVTPYKVALFIAGQNEVTGNSFTQSLSFIRAPSAGNHTYKIRWASNLGGSGGTVYSNGSVLTAKAFKNS